MQKDTLALALILNGCVQTFLQRSSNSIHRTSLPLCQHTRSHFLDTYHWLVLANMRISCWGAGLRSPSPGTSGTLISQMPYSGQSNSHPFCASVVTASGDSVGLSSTARLSGKFKVWTAARDIVDDTRGDRELFNSSLLR